MTDPISPFREPSSAKRFRRIAVSAATCAALAGMLVATQIGASSESKFGPDRFGNSRPQSAQKSPAPTSRARNDRQAPRFGGPGRKSWVAPTSAATANAPDPVPTTLVVVVPEAGFPVEPQPPETFVVPTPNPEPVTTPETSSTTIVAVEPSTTKTSSATTSVSAPVTTVPVATVGVTTTVPPTTVAPVTTLPSTTTVPVTTVAVTTKAASTSTTVPVTTVAVTTKAASTTTTVPSTTVARVTTLPAMTTLPATTVAVTTKAASTSTTVPVTTVPVTTKAATTTTTTSTTVPVTTKVAATTTVPATTRPAERVSLSLSPVVRMTEGQATSFTVTASQTLASDVTLQLSAGSGTARLDDRSTGRDLTIPTGTYVMKAGSKSLAIAIDVRNDDIRELDETQTIVVTQVGGSSPAVVGSVDLTIVDDDRRLIVNVRDEGAVGNGVTDDTAAINRANEKVFQAGGGVVRFPAGTYIVGKVYIRPGVTFHGEGGIIKRAPNQGFGTRSFTTDGDPYYGAGPSAPLVIEGLTFDGNRSQQPEYRNHQLEQAHLVMLTAHPQSPGKLRAFVDKSFFHDGVADAISIYVNVSVVITDSIASDVFRGGLVMTGGGSDITVDHFTTTGASLPTGMDAEIDGAGYGGSTAIKLRMNDIDLDSDFDLGLGAGGSDVVIDRLNLRRGPYYSYTPGSTVVIKNSTLHVGGADGYNNRALYPHDLTFENSTIVVDPQAGASVSAFDVWFDHPTLPTQPYGRLRFRNVAFVRGEGPTSSPSYGVYRRIVRSGDVIEYENVTWGPGFTKQIGP